MHTDLETSVRAATRRLLLSAAALGLLLPGVATADPQEAADKPAPPAKAREATPDSPSGGAGVSYAPTAGVWRDRLVEARRRVLETTARLDEINGEYARVLYEHPDDAKLVASHAKMRADAREQVREARAAIPPLIEAARADGVSETVLDLYEQGTLGD